MAFERSARLGGAGVSSRAARRARRPRSSASSSRLGEHSHSRVGIAVRPGDVDHRGTDPGGLQVHGQLVAGAELAVELGEAGHAVTRRAARRAPARPGAGSGPRPDHRRRGRARPRRRRPARHPISSPGALVEGPAERRDRVLGQHGPGAPVGEGDRACHRAILTSRRIGTKPRSPRPGPGPGWPVQNDSSWWLKGPGGVADALSVASIRAECPSCGDVRLRPGDLTVRLFGAEESGTYAFACPHCGDVGDASGQRPHRLPARLRRRPARGRLAARRGLRAPHRAPRSTPTTSSTSTCSSSRTDGSSASPRWCAAPATEKRRKVRHPRVSGIGSRRRYDAVPDEPHRWSSSGMRG